jgi:hypothetical protein
VVDTLPAPPGCDRVIVIGDSLTAAPASLLRSELAANGYDAYVSGASNRRVPRALPPPFSGVRSALAVRGSWGDAECWVIALGSNDISSGADKPSVANGLIDEMLGAVTPDATVWWVNVDHRNERGNSVDLVAATRLFNNTLAARAADDLKFSVIDWYSLAEANRHWFIDAVHVDRSGGIARSRLIVASLFPASR